MSIERSAVLFNGNITVSGTGDRVVIDGLYGSAYVNVINAPTSPDTIDLVIEERDPQTGLWYEVASFTQIDQGSTTERVVLPAVFTNTLRASWTASASFDSAGCDLLVTVFTKEESK